MFADAGNYCVDVGLRVAENKRIVDVHDYVCRLRWCDAVKEAVIEGRHVVPFCEKSGPVVEVKDSSGVW